MGSLFAKPKRSRPTVVGRLVQNKSITELLQISWKTCRSACPVLPGAYILKEIFRMDSEVKVMFNFTEIETFDELLTSPAFLRHSGVFTNVMELVLRNVATLEIDVSPTLITLGRRHRYKREIGFKVEHFDLFGAAMMSFVCRFDRNAREGTSLHSAWENVAQFVVQKVKEGHELERRNKTDIVDRFQLKYN